MCVLNLEEKISWKRVQKEALIKRTAQRHGGVNSVLVRGGGPHEW